MRRLGIYVIITACLLAPDSNARIRRDVSYEEFYDSSDLIVIAQPTTKTTDTDESTYFEKIVRTGIDGKKTRVPAIGVETSFDVSLVIKGDCPSKSFVLHHYRTIPPSENGPLSIGGPALVSFDPSDSLKRRDVMLFLMREQDGRYAPYGGQTDPSGTSIFALERPQ